MSKPKKITAEQLDRINADQKALVELLTNIGLLESQKHAMLHNLATLNESIENFKLTLEKEYGPVNIDLKDGSYTLIKQEAKE